jgi:hypothetical protein
LIISEVLKVENKQSSGDFEEDSGQERSWLDITPVCLGIRDEFIEKQENGQYKKECYQPATRVYYYQVCCGQV